MNRLRSSGFSLVEVLLAAAIFGLIATICVGAYVYGRGSAVQTGNRDRALRFADEAIQAIRNIRDDNYANLTDGTYGLAKSGGVWALSGSSDTIDIYTRQVTIATSATNRRLITATVKWSDATRANQQVSVNALLTNWLANVVPAVNPTLAGSLDLLNNYAGYKIATQGNYAYLIRNTGSPNFFVINIATPSSPNVIATTTLNGNPTNITVSGNYAYITNSSDSAEFSIINISNPGGPNVLTSYDAPGAADGLSVAVSGNYAYLVRAANSANNELVVLDIGNPQVTPTRLGGYNLNVTMNDIVLNGTAAYIATNSSTQKVLVLNVATPSSPTVAAKLALSGTAAASHLTGFGTTLAVAQGTVLYTLDASVPLSPTQAGSVTLPATISDLSSDSTGKYVFAGTNYTSGQLQIVNVATISSPSVLASTAVGTASTLAGVAYNSSLNVVVGATSLTNKEFVLFTMN